MLAIAIHDGHEVRKEISRYLLIDEFERLREEDPYTGYITQISGNRMIINTSRFEVDVNRPRNLSIYRTPENAWGLKVWKENVSEDIWRRTYEEYDKFYVLFKRILNEIINVWGFVIIYDIHSYNYLREGNPGENDNIQNPEINVGTASMYHQRWAPVVNYFIREIRNFNYLGRHLDVRENVRFKGGHLSWWVHHNFPQISCVLSIELKKIFMDEWTGSVDIFQLRALKEALLQTVPGVIQQAQIINNRNKKRRVAGKRNKTNRVEKTYKR